MQTLIHSEFSNYIWIPILFYMQNLELVGEVVMQVTFYPSFAGKLMVARGRCVIVIPATC